MSKKNEVAVYSTGNGNILGRRTGNTIVGINVDVGTAYDRTDFAALKLAELRGTLVEVEIGMNSTVAKRSLIPEEKLNLKMVNLQMKEAKKLQETWLIEQVFTDLGKKL